MNKFFYNYKGVTKKISLPIGEFSQIMKIKTSIIDSTLPKDKIDIRKVSFIASPKGNKKEFFFSSRSALIKSKLKYHNSLFNYLEIKGCGKPNFGISSKEYFLEDGRDRDKFYDPIGGYSLEKAILEWESMKKLKDSKIRTQLPLLLLKLENIYGPKGEDLSLIVKTGLSNIRLGYFNNNTQRIKQMLGKNFEDVVNNVLFYVGDSLRKLHKTQKICHNALHEENITLNGEIVDFEYASNSENELVYRDLWYCLLSFAEVFGTPLDLTKFLETYVGIGKKFVLQEKNSISLEEECKEIAKFLV